MDRERFDQSRLGDLSLWQPKAGYRFNIDSVLLAAFASPLTGPVADLGAGCGVICALLARRGLAGPFTALEIDPERAAACQANFSELSIPGEVIEGDLAQPSPEPRAGGYRLVASNPPYVRAGHGRVPPDPSRARARQEAGAGGEALWAAAARLLSSRGRLALLWSPKRLVEALSGLAAHRLTPKRLRLVHGRADRPAFRALIEAVKDGGEELVVEPPLVVYGTGRDYGPEVAAIYQDLVGLGPRPGGR